jgi:hypothetical protein
MIVIEPANPKKFLWLLLSIQKFTLNIFSNENTGKYNTGYG